MYPNATVPERIAEGVVHFIGVLGAITSAVMLLFWASGMVSAGALLALAIYSVALITTFAASAIYNMMPFDRPRPMLRRIDHAAIYLKIAGTYTPLVVMIGTGFAYMILGLIWALALIRITLKLFFWRKPSRFGPALYLIMGWLSIFLIWSLIPVVPSAVIWLIAAGGLLYTAGVPIYAAKKMPFSTPVWHGFIVTASACFFAAIALGAATLT